VMNLFVLAAIETFKPWSREDISSDCQNSELELDGRILCVVLDKRCLKIRIINTPCSEICLHISVVCDICGS